MLIKGAPVRKQAENCVDMNPNYLVKLNNGILLLVPIILAVDESNGYLLCKTHSESNFPINKPLNTFGVISASDNLDLCHCNSPNLWPMADRVISYRCHYAQ